MGIGNCVGELAWDNFLPAVLYYKMEYQMAIRRFSEKNNPWFFMWNSIDNLPAANAQQDPQAPWSFTSEIAYFALQSTWGGKWLSSPDPLAVSSSSPLPIWSKM